MSSELVSGKVDAHCGPEQSVYIGRFTQVQMSFQYVMRMPYNPCWAIRACPKVNVSISNFLNAKCLGLFLFSLGWENT